MNPYRALLLCLALLFAAAPGITAGGDVAEPLPAEALKPFTWRAIGPANMSGRITAISVFEADPSAWWIATASGGLLKTVNNGVTFEHQFDREATVSIGDVCVAPSDRNVVWVGTGENNPRNSVSYGDGVYKSVDGGKSWTNMGLKKSFQIGRIAVHPKNPDVVYAGALGRLYGPSQERGLFRTVDGGKSWEKVLYVDDRTGVIDLALHPKEPDTLFVALWDRQRDGFDSFVGETPADGHDTYDPARKWGAGAGIYKTVDGGRTFTKLTQGLPSGRFGRIGLDIYRKDPSVIFAIIDCEKIGMGTPPPSARPGASTLGVQAVDAPDAKGARLTEVLEQGPGDRAGLRNGDVVRAVGDKEIKTAEELTAAVLALKPNDKVKVKYVREEQEADVEVTVAQRPAATGYMGIGNEGGDAPGGGARLDQLTEGGPVQQAGLQAGDVIKKLGEREIKAYADLLEVARTSAPGQKVKLVYVRGAETKEVEFTYGERRGGFGGRGGGGGGFGGPGGATASRPYLWMYGGQQPNVQAQQGPDSHEYGGLYKSTNGGESWTRVNSINPRPMYFSQVRVDPSDENHVYVLGVSLHYSSDGGKSFRTTLGGIHADQHALWIDPRDGRHLIVGTDGGFYASWDRGRSWDHLNHLALGQFYHVAAGPGRAYWVYGGLQDNGSWGGPSVGLHGNGPVNEDWLSVGSGDGFVCRVDWNDPNWVYYESQNGVMARRNLKTGERGSIRPARVQGAPPYRFNWNTPFILSRHNTRIFTCAGNFVFRSVNRGDDLKVISPEITLTKRGSATALAESPRNPDVLWAGTDDGALWVTRNGGKDWKNVWEKVGLPGPRWVATIEASLFSEGRAYVCFDAHRSNDDEPYVYATEDFGETWKSVRANLPAGSSRCLREDAKNASLLYCGTEFAVFVSLDRGGSWTRINNNLPTVAIHEIAVHPTVDEIVAATHGRSLWILDVSALRQLSAAALKEKPLLYKPSTAVQWEPLPTRGRTNRRFTGQNPEPGAPIYYSLPKKAEKLSLRITDIDAKLVAELRAVNEPGLHKVSWNLRGPAPRGPGGGGRGGGGAAPPQAQERFGQAGGLRAAPGTYRVVLTVDGQEISQSFRVEADPQAPSRGIGEAERLPDLPPPEPPAPEKPAPPAAPPGFRTADTALKTEIRKGASVGSSQAGYLGLFATTEGGKIVVDDVETDSPAAKAGLQPGDVVVKFCGEPVKDDESLREKVLARPPGEAVKVDVLRKDKPLALTATLAATSRPLKLGTERPIIGVSLGEPREGEGAPIARISTGSPAERAGLKVGEVIAKADGKPITGTGTLSDLLSEKKSGDKVALVVRRDGKEVEVQVEVAVESFDRSGTEFFRGGNFWKKDVYRLGVICIEYPDVKHNAKIALTDWEESLFSKGKYAQKKSATGETVHGSLNDYYLEQSFGALRVEGRVFDWVLVGKNRQDYAPGTGTGLRDRTALLVEALEKVVARDGKAALDALDGIYFMYAGDRVRNASRGSLYWPHRSNVTFQNRRWAYFIVPEGGNRMGSISVIAHEFGHLLGLPDLYARPESPGSEGLGTWCAMSNQAGSGRPQHFSAWCKEQLGWVKPAVIDPTVRQKLVLAPIEDSPKECLKVLLRPDGSEYFLLENRRKKGFDESLPAEGLLIWRVVGNRPVLEESHGVEGPRGPGGFAASVPDPSGANNAFTPHTTPSSRSQLGGGLPVYITNIRRLPDGRITFFVGYDFQ